MRHRVLLKTIQVLFETSRQKGKNIWSHVVPEIGNKSGVNNLKQKVDQACKGQPKRMFFSNFIRM